MFTNYAETMVETSGLKSIEEMFSALSSEILVTNNEHSYEQTMVANLAAIKLKDSYDVVEGTYDAYFKDAIHQNIRNNVTNTFVQDKIINLEKDQMGVIFSDRIINQFCQARFTDLKNTTYSVSTELMSKAVSGMDLDLNIGSLRQFFSGISEDIQDDENFSLEIRLKDHSNTTEPLLFFTPANTIDTNFGLEVDVMDNTGKKMFTVSMDVDMNGQIWYNSNDMDFKDLKFEMSNSQVLTEGVAHKSTSNMFYSAASNFIEKYIADNFDDFIVFSKWDKIVDNKFVRVTIVNIYQNSHMLIFKLSTYWKKDMDAILVELKANKN